jgi:hypothetical protein
MRIRVIVRNDGIIFDFDGFKGMHCVEEFQRLLKFLNRAGLEVSVGEMRMKSGVTDAADLRDRR